MIQPFRAVNGQLPSVTTSYGGYYTHSDSFYHEHFAVDFGLNGQSFPVVAAASGTLTRHDVDGATTAFIDHGRGWKTVYMHLKDLTVDGRTIWEGQSVWVPQGKMIGNSGNTGHRSQGVHLHFSLRADYTGRSSDYIGNNTWTYPIDDALGNRCPEGALFQGQTVEGSLSGSYEEKTYCFTGYANQYVNIRLEANNSGLDPVLSLYIDGRLIAQNDDADGNTNSRIYGRLPQNGTYIITASPYPDTSGNYRLTLGR